MELQFDNLYTAQKAIDIQDLGQCAIEGINDEGLYFYFVIITERGMSTIATCGPVIPDIFDLPEGYTANIVTMKYNPKKLKLNIFKWLNSSKPGKNKPITEATEISQYEALKQFRDIGEYLINDKLLNTRRSDEIGEDAQ